LVSLAKLGDFPQAIFNTSNKSVFLRLHHAQFILVPLPNVCGALREFRFEARPCNLMLMIVLALKLTECLLG